MAEWRAHPCIFLDLRENWLGAARPTESVSANCRSVRNLTVDLLYNFPAIKTYKE